MAAQRLCAAHRGRRWHGPDDLDAGVCGDPGEQVGGQRGVGHRRGGGWRWAQCHVPTLPSSTPSCTIATQLSSCVFLSFEAMTVTSLEKRLLITPPRSMLWASGKWKAPNRTSKWKKFRWKKGMLSPGLLALMTPDDKKLIETRAHFLCPQSCYLSPSLFLCMHRVFTCTQAWAEGSFLQPSIWGKGGLQFAEVVMENDLMRREIWWDYQSSLCLERLSGQPNLSWIDGWWGGACWPGRQKGRQASKVPEEYLWAMKNNFPFCQSLCTTPYYLVCLLLLCLHPPRFVQACLIIPGLTKVISLLWILCVEWGFLLFWAFLMCHCMYW